MAGFEVTPYGRFCLTPEAHGAHADFAQDLDPNAIVSLIRFEAEAFIGFDSVTAIILQAVCTNFVGEADSATFLAQVKQHTATLGGDLA
jgi:hypothetical protein